MRSLTCIVCPIGCSLDVEEDANSQNSLSVTGNRCPRGEVYAREEIRAPKRVVTATCRIEGEVGFPGSVRRVPVKTASPCPREKIPFLLQDIYKAAVSLPVKAGDVVIAGWKGEEINVIVTRTLE
jgi:CxxC motif-containing protein